MQSGFITLSNGEEIYHEEWGVEYKGKCPSLLFVHGNFSTLEWWYDSIEQLKSIQRHIIAVDQRGFGKSSFKNTCNRLVSWAEDLRDLCKVKGIEKCVAIGWSFGGTVAMKFAQIAPELVQKIVLTCSVSNEGLKFVDDGKPCSSREDLLANKKIKFMVQVMQSQDREKMAQIYESLLFTYCQHLSKEKKMVIVEGCFKQRCYVQLMESLANADIDLSKVKAECLMIHGKQDMVITWDSVKNMKQHFNNVHLWENNAHMIPVENPKEYAKMIADFV